MFGLLASLSSLVKYHEDHEVFNYENYIAKGQKIPTNRIFRESSPDRRARKHLSAIRYKEQIKRQIKLVRLMKKLLSEMEQETSDQNINEQIRNKVAHIEHKVEKAARTQNISCEDMIDMDKPDDEYDIQLEQIVRHNTFYAQSSRNIDSYKKQQQPSSNTTKEILSQISKSCGDYTKLEKVCNKEDNLTEYDSSVYLKSLQKC